MARVICQVSVSEDLNDSLTRLADEYGLTKSGVMNMLIRIGLRTMSNEVKQEEK